MPKPIVQLARLAVALDELGVARLHDGPPGMTGICLNIAALHGGVAFNVIPQRGQLEWSLRPYPGFDRARWDADVAARDRAIDPAITLGVDRRSRAVCVRRRSPMLVRPFVDTRRRARLLDRGRALRSARHRRDRRRPRRHRPSARRRRVRHARGSRLGGRAVPRVPRGARLTPALSFDRRSRGSRPCTSSCRARGE